MIYDDELLAFVQRTKRKLELTPVLSKLVDLGEDLELPSTSRGLETRGASAALQHRTTTNTGNRGRSPRLVVLRVVAPGFSVAELWRPSPGCHHPLLAVPADKRGLIDV